jgi:hypothetical protein
MSSQDTFSSNHKLNESLSTYLSRAHLSRTIACLPHTKQINYIHPDSPRPTNQDSTDDRPSKKTFLETAIIASRPIAGSNTTNAPNTDRDMLGKYLAPTPAFHFQGISDLLPPVQKAPDNMSGEYSNSFNNKAIHTQDTISNTRATIAPSNPELQ